MTAAPAGFEFAQFIERNPLKAIDRRFLALLVGSMATHLVLATLVALQPSQPLEDPLPVVIRRSPLMKNPFAKPAVSDPVTNSTATAAPKSGVNSSASTTPRVSAPVSLAHTGLLAVIGAKGNGGIDDVLSESGEDLAQALTGVTSLQVATLETAQRKGEEKGKAEVIGAMGTDGVKTVALQEKTVAKVTVKTEIDTSTLPQTGDIRGLGAFLNQRKNSLEHCYTAAAKARPTLAGKLMLRITLAGAGKPSEVEVDDETLGSDRVSSCVRTVVSNWTFPFQVNSTIELPLVFAPAN